MSLALKHKQSVLAAQAAQGTSQPAASTVSAAAKTPSNPDSQTKSAFAGLKENLENELITLNQANGDEERDPYKKELIEKYREFANHLMTFDNFKDLTVLFRWLMWRLDLEGFEAVQADMLNAVNKGLTSPKEFKRDFVTIYVDEVFAYSNTAFKKGSEFNAEFLTHVIDNINAGEWAINPEIKAKLFALLGKIQHKNGNCEMAAKSYATALNLNSRVGVKKLKAKAEKGEQFNG